MQERDRIEADALEESRRQLVLLEERHIQAMADLRESASQSLACALQEKTCLLEQLSDMSITYANTVEQLSDKTNNLEALRGQAKTREQLISSLQEDLQHKGKCTNHAFVKIDKGCVPSLPEVRASGL